MKKFIFLIFIFLPICMLAEEINYLNFNGYIYNEMLKKLIKEDIKLSYDTDEKNICFYYTSDFMTRICLEINEESRSNLILLINKYEEWNKKAIQKKITLEKDIGKIKVQTSFKYGDEWYMGVDASGEITISFFSQSVSTHQLVFSFLKILSKGNEFISVTPKDLYFYSRDVANLKKGLNYNFIQSNIKKELDKKKIEEDFK